MSDSTRHKIIRDRMDKTDIEYVIELLSNALQDLDWDTVIEAKEFLREYADDDGGPIELEE